MTEPDGLEQTAFVAHLEERLKTAVTGITGTDKVIVVVRAAVGPQRGGGRAGKGDVLKTKEKSARDAELLPGVPQKKQYTIGESTVFSGQFQSRGGTNYLRVASVTILIDRGVSEERIAEARDAVSRIIGPGEESRIDIQLVDFRSSLSAMFKKPQFYWMASITLAGIFLAVVAYYLSTALMKLTSSVSGSLDINQNVGGRHAAGGKVGVADYSALSPDLQRQMPGGEQAAEPEGPFSFIRPRDVASLASILSERSAVEGAIVVNFMKPDLAMKLLQRLPDEKRAEIIAKLSGMKEFSPEEVSGIADALSEGLKRTVRGEEKAASLLGLASGELREKVFNMIGGESDGATARLRGKVKSIEALFEEMSQQDIQRIFRSFDISAFARLLRTFPEDVQKKVLTSLTEKAAERLQQEMELGRPLPQERLMEEKIEMLAFIQGLAETGALDLSPQADV